MTGELRQGIYEHYKSTPEDRKLYQVLMVAQHTENDDILAIYVPLYFDPTQDGIRVQARPVEMFTGEVSHNGEIVPRFRYLGQEAT